MINTTTSCCSVQQEKPSAHITVKKGRLKIYGKEKEPCIYMQHGQEFEIELFNPTNTYQLAKIEINGKSISNSGICLRPGERVFLERYIDNPNKFKFETYEVTAGCGCVDKAIANNGNIRVLFYTEQTNITYSAGCNTTTISSPIWYNHTGNTYYTSDTIPVNGNNVFFSSTGNQAINSSFTTTNSLYDSSVTFNSDYLLDSLKDIVAPSLEFETPATEEKTKETGRIEEGSNSKQKFDHVSKSFSYWSNTIIDYKLLPFSEKVVTIDEIKKFCTECGKNLKPNFKFCPSCGCKA